jgi:hypothetical protein
VRVEATTFLNDGSGNSEWYRAYSQPIFIKGTEFVRYGDPEPEITSMKLGSPGGHNLRIRGRNFDNPCSGSWLHRGGQMYNITDLTVRTPNDIEASIPWGPEDVERVFINCYGKECSHEVAFPQEQQPTYPEDSWE